MGGRSIHKSKSDPGGGKARQHHQRQRNWHSKANRHNQQQKAKNQLSENLSFCGCGFLGIYHVGVASCFHEYVPQLSMHKIAGSSVGALVAVAHICGNLQVAYATTDILRVAIDARARTLGPLHPSFDINSLVRDALEKGLPDDIHTRVSGKLHISLTRVYDRENVIVSKFDSKEDVIQALICSCFIPFWSGLVAPKYKGVTYIDGGFSNNLLILDDKTVTVSPFAGETDICPRDDVNNLLSISLSNTSFHITPHNLYRLSHALLPPSPEMLSELCEQGFADAIRFLQRTRLITCSKCLEIRSSLVVTSETEIEVEKTPLTYSRQQQQMLIGQQESSSSSANVSLFEESGILELEQEELEENCNGCLSRRRDALCDPLPKQVTDRIREACDNVNKSLSNWFYSHRPIKYLSYLAAPYYLPMNISLALFLKYCQQLPSITGELCKCVYDLKDFLVDIMSKLQERSTTSLLMSPSSFWGYENDGANGDDTTSLSSSESSISVKITADCRRSSIKSLATYEYCLTIVLFGRQNVSASSSKCV